MPAGRPTKYKPDYARQARVFAERGAATDENLAELFDVTVPTINTWKKLHPEFLSSIKEGKAITNARVERSLFERATGYSHPEDKIFNNNGEAMVVPTIKHYPPDTAAAFIWLKNRDPERWRDKQDIVLSGGVTFHAPNELDD